MPRSFHAGAPFLVLLHAVAGTTLLLGCAGSDGTDPPGVQPFMPGAGGATAVSAGAAGTGGAPAPARVQGEPEQSPDLPLPSGSGVVPVSDDVGAGAAETPPPAALPTLEHVLVFSRTVGYRHEAIGPGIDAIVSLGVAAGFAVEATEDGAQFSDENLAGFDVVVFLSTTADVLDDGQQAAFERYIRAGGGWVGVHAAADREYEWPG